MSRARVAWIALALCAGCAQTDVVATRDRADGSTPRDGAVDRCADPGPPIAVGDATVCSGRLAERTFRFALCTCADVVAGEVVTDSFDSRRGPYSAPGGAGGSIGASGSINASDDWAVGGSLWSSGAEGWSSAGDLVVASQLHVMGRVAGPGVDVDGDAFVAGGAQLDTLRVGGTLTAPSLADVRVDGARTVGAEVEAPVTVDPPCACGEADLLDVAGFVAAQREDNDNAAIDLAVDDWSNLLGATNDVELPCGRFLLSSVSVEGDLSLRATGPVVLFVEGDLVVNGSLSVELEADASIDLFVAGNVTVGGRASLGGVGAPARARLYVGGGGTINLGADATFAGTLYAPRTALVAAGPVEVFGAMFVQRVNASGRLTLHYDAAVLRTGEACEPTRECATCGDCASVQACVDGRCADCRDDRDCCSPLVCAAGRCLPEPV